MSATLSTMEYVHVDNLFPNQLMEEDLIEITDDNAEKVIVTVRSIHETIENYIVDVEDEYGDSYEIIFADNAQIKLFILQ